ncbi:hypothetical protein K3495_g1474 [Podosphaera aphanis]|nr:hypothetical protein K3495_g1474 [Podosphaera aphanis]
MDSFPEPQQGGTSPDILPLTVRFTNAFDLSLDILAPDQVSVVGLRLAVRSKLDPPLSQQRLRFIYRGRILKDDEILSEVLKRPCIAPLPDPTGKGKARAPPPPRVYVNCSLGDVMSAAELSSEADAAKISPRKSRLSHTAPSEKRGQISSHTPRGFDRLLSGGFTPTEVNQLRLQFRSIQQSIHTPETMPSPNSLLNIEDAWIDDNSGNGPGATGIDFGDDGLGGGAIDDILWGNIIGFVWPLGCIGFLMRESGVWSRRRQMAVSTGFILSVAFGILRAIS